MGWGMEGPSIFFGAEHEKVELRTGAPTVKPAGWGLLCPLNQEIVNEGAFVTGSERGFGGGGRA